MQLLNLANTIIHIKYNGHSVSYSAYFVELNKALQDDIIGRTSLSFD